MKIFSKITLGCVLLLLQLPLAHAQTSEYHLVPGDIIEVSVWKDEALTNTLIIRPDGKISFPLIGEILTKDKSVDTVRQEIQAKIREYVPDSPVTVILREINYPNIYVVGKVNNPGMFTITGQPLTVLQALAMAGGMTDFADKDDIIILRQSGGRQQVFEFDYSKVSRGGSLGQNITLQAGDTVVVP